MKRAIPDRATASPGLKVVFVGQVSCHNGVSDNRTEKRFMADPQGYTTRLQGLLERWAQGDDSAIDEIIAHSQDRLRRMAHRMLAGKPHVGRWNQTDDLLQNALVRLHRALKAVKPDSKPAFNGLAATQIRRELI